MLKDVLDGKRAREPVSVVIKEAVNKTNLNGKLLQRMIDYQ